MKGVCLLIAGILFLLLFFSFSGVKKTKLLDTDGRNFEKAEVTEVISGNLSNSGSGKQTVELKLLSGDHKGKQYRQQVPKVICLVQNVKRE